MPHRILDLDVLSQDPTSYLRALATLLHEAAGELDTALDEGDPDAIQASCRRLLSIGNLAYTAGNKL